MYLEANEIEEFIRQHDRDTKAIKEELLRICWFMRGSVSFTEAHLLTVEEREIIAKIIEGNLETTRETQMPFF